MASAAPASALLSASLSGTTNAPALGETFTSIDKPLRFSRIDFAQQDGLLAAHLARSVASEYLTTLETLTQTSMATATVTYSLNLSLLSSSAPATTASPSNALQVLDQMLTSTSSDPSSFVFQPSTSSWTSTSTTTTTMTFTSTLQPVTSPTSTSTVYVAPATSAAPASTSSPPLSAASYSSPARNAYSGVIAGIVLGSLYLLSVWTLVCFFHRRRRRRDRCEARRAGLSHNLVPMRPSAAPPVPSFPPAHYDDLPDAVPAPRRRSPLLHSLPRPPSAAALKGAVMLRPNRVEMPHRSRSSSPSDRLSSASESRRSTDETGLKKPNYPFDLV